MTKLPTGDWRDVPEYEGIYMVDVLSGRLWSSYVRRTLRPFRNREGYLQTTLSKDGRKRLRCIHRLVCEAAHGPAPFGGAQVRHLDGNPCNNHMGNLCWGTASENQLDRARHGTATDNGGDRHRLSKVSNEDATDAQMRYALGEGTVRSWADKLGITKNAAWRLLRGIGYRESYQQAQKRLRP